MGYYLTQEELIDAVKALKENNVPIEDIFTPFPIHGLDELVGLKKSRIPTIGFIGGALGVIGAFGFQAWVFTVDYPLIIGGKPYLSVPSFIPVTFEITILFASIFMVFAFLIKSKLGLGAKNRIYDEKITDNHFVIIAGPGTDDGGELERARKSLAGTGGLDIRTIED